MPDPTRTPPPATVPLCVDLDGTLIFADMMWESIKALMQRNPLWLFPILFWWSRGRAHLKQQLAAHVSINPASLPYNPALLEFLREARKSGRRLALASASDLGMVEPVARHVGLFDDVLASDGRTNLRGRAKLKALAARYGERGFDYAGNSSVDLAVWRGSREAIVVNANARLARRAARLATVGRIFPKPPLAKRILAVAKSFCTWRYLLAGGSGLLLAAAFPNLGIAGLAWIAPALMILPALGREPGEAFRLGYVAGLSFWLASLYWLLLIPVTGFPILGWLSLSAYLALYPAAWVWLVNRAAGVGKETLVAAACALAAQPWTRRVLWAVSGAAAWVALEMLRGWLFTGFPWNPLGASQFKLLPLIQVASVTGVYGVSFLVVWTSLSLLLAVLVVFRQPARRSVWVSEIFLPFLTIAVLFSSGLRRLADTSASERHLRVAFIQPSIPQTMIWDSAENATRFHQVLSLSEEALRDGADLLVWPEAALPTFDETTYAAITNLVRTHRVWMIFGADDVEPHADGRPPDYFNAAFLIDPAGEFVASYRKRNLVAFGEYIPLSGWLPFLKWFTPITGGYTPGTQPVDFPLGELGVRTSVLICFEDIFPRLARKSVDEDTDFLLNLTNNGWFGESAAQWQHAAAAVFRAIENGLPLLRCSNNGLTCWVDERGRIRETLHDSTGGIYGPGVMVAQIPLPSPDSNKLPSFYWKHGDWFGWVSVGLTVAALFFRGTRQNEAN